jgi:hypothetical protein
MYLLAYHLIPGVLAKAAEAHDAVPRKFRFKGALQAITAFEESRRFASADRRPPLWKEMLKAVASHEVGNRPGRVEPRAGGQGPLNPVYGVFARSVRPAVYGG